MISGAKTQLGTFFFAPVLSLFILQGFLGSIKGKSFAPGHYSMGLLNQVKTGSPIHK